MAKRKILTDRDPTLRQISRPVERITPRIQQLLDDMLETMHAADGVGLAADEGLWFYTSPTNQMVSRAPEEQDVMVRGCRDAILTMLESEPSGAGYQNPGFYK